MTDSSFADLAVKIRQGVSRNYSGEPKMSLSLEADTLVLKGNEAGLALLVTTLLAQEPTESFLQGEIQQISYDITPGEYSQTYIRHKRLFKHFNTLMGILTIVAGLAVLLGIVVTFITLF